MIGWALFAGLLAGMVIWLVMTPKRMSDEEMRVYMDSVLGVPVNTRFEDTPDWAAPYEARIERVDPVPTDEARAMLILRIDVIPAPETDEIQPWRLN